MFDVTHYDNARNIFAKFFNGPKYFLQAGNLQTTRSRMYFFLTHLSRDFCDSSLHVTSGYLIMTNDISLQGLLLYPPAPHGPPGPHRGVIPHHAAPQVPGDKQELAGGGLPERDGGAAHHPPGQAGRGVLRHGLRGPRGHSARHHRQLVRESRNLYPQFFVAEFLFLYTLLRQN